MNFYDKYDRWEWEYIRWRVYPSDGSKDNSWYNEKERNVIEHLFKRIEDLEEVVERLDNIISKIDPLLLDALSKDEKTDTK